jgi:hypothetical protein
VKRSPDNHKFENSNRNRKESSARCRCKEFADFQEEKSIEDERDSISSFNPVSPVSSEQKVNV